MPSQAEKIATFKALHERDGAFIIPNPYDVGSARMLAGLGFEALATTSSGLAMTLGRSDMQVSLDEKIAHCRALVGAVDLPINADLEKGFADDPEGVAETIARAQATGLAGASIEDATANPDDPIFALDRAVARVKAAVDANAATDNPMVITARAENLLWGLKDLDDTIKRLQAFEDAGADVLYAPGLRTLDDVRKVTAAVGKPINVLGVMVRDGTVQSMADAGAKRISVGGALARAAAGEFLRAAVELLDDGTHTFAKRAARNEMDDLMSKGRGSTPNEPA
ncbi:MAG: isocitrate lyase/phosphoenolpyruvate mutase family protein [Pseudomonadota bacterium]